MRVLQLHNRYRTTGGEERCVELIEKALAGQGVECTTIYRESSKTSKPSAAWAMLRGGQKVASVVKAIEEQRPDVIHAHNLNPFFGPRALKAAKAMRAKVVMHLHNYRLFCAIGIAFRDGGPCFDCSGRNTLPGLLHRCRGSVAESVVYAASLAAHQGRIINNVDRFIVPSNFARERLVELGLPAGKVEVVANPAPDGAMVGSSKAGKGQYAFMSGRLSAEKGVELAIEASATSGVPLVIAGDGPERQRLEPIAASNSDMRLLGNIGEDELKRLREDAAFAVMPSLCPENCPFAALEAMAAGLPLLVSKNGGLPELATSEQTVAPGDGQRWADAFAKLWRDPGLRQRLGEENLARAKTQLSERSFGERLLAIYSKLIPNPPVTQRSVSDDESGHRPSLT